MESSELLTGLNPEQQAAVLHGTGPAMVLAGAGSGKTRVLTTRAAYLIQERHVSPDAILLVTFTNKAAQEMNDRVQRLVGRTLGMSGTFHRLCAKILRQDGEVIGLSRSYVIYDDDDQLDLIKSILHKLNLSPKEYAPRLILSNISHAKNELIGPHTYSTIARGKYQEATARVYELYEKGLKENNAVDFDNLLNKTLEMLEKHADVRQRYQQLFEHVLVDEYQDVNKAQYLLTKIFAAPDNNLFCVGDFAQNIYGWRGADYRNMLLLKQDFPDIAEYRLEQNYRSTQTILDAATAVIANNTTHPILSLWTKDTTTERIQLFEAETDRDEVEFLIQEVQKLKMLYSLSEMTVLYRTNAQSRIIEDACMRSGIPYRLVGGLRFYARKEVKDVLAYVRLYVNPNDTIAEGRIVKLGKRKHSAYLEWLHAQQNKPQNPLEVIDSILAATQYKDGYDPKIEEELSRLENIEELRSVATEFSSLEQFMENVALIENDASARDEKNEERLTLMSVHSAKGLEFRVVFMVGMEEGLFPHSRSMLDKEQLEEERRLCYVGITRAKQHLYLSYTRRRMLYGTITGSIVSRFIAEIPPELLHSRSSSTYRQFTPTKRTAPKIFVDDPSLDSVLNGDMDIDTFLGS